MKPMFLIAAGIWLVGICSGVPARQHGQERQSTQQESSGSEKTAKKGDWVRTGDLEFRLIKATRSSLVQLSFEIYTEGNSPTSRFKAIVNTERGVRFGLEEKGPLKKLYLNGGEEMVFLPFDLPLVLQERALEIVSVVLEARSSITQFPVDKARLLDKTGKTIATADKLAYLLDKRLFNWGEKELPKGRRMFLFAVFPEQKNLRFQLAENPAVIFEE